MNTKAKEVLIESLPAESATPIVNGDKADVAFSKAQAQITANASQISTNTNNLSTEITNRQTGDNQNAANLSTHEANYSNPHQVTLEQARAQGNLVAGDIDMGTHKIVNVPDATTPQQPLTKNQFDNYNASVGRNKGPIDCSTNPNYPAANVGDRFEVTVAGKIGGANGITVNVWDEIVCSTANSGGDQATVGADFYIVQGNIDRATETTSGFAALATITQALAGTDDQNIMTALKVMSAIVDQNKVFNSTVPVYNLTEIYVQMQKDGTIQGMSASSDITGLQYKIGANGTYAAFSANVAFTAGQQVWFKWTYVSQTVTTGNIFFNGKYN